MKVETIDENAARTTAMLLRYPYFKACFSAGVPRHTCVPRDVVMCVAGNYQFACLCGLASGRGSSDSLLFQTSRWQQQVNNCLVFGDARIGDAWMQLQVALTVALRTAIAT